MDVSEDRKILYICGTRSLITLLPGNQPDTNRPAIVTVSDDRAPYRLDPAGQGQYKQRVHAMNTRFFAWRVVIAASFRGCAGLLTIRSGKEWAYGMPSCDLN